MFASQLLYIITVGLCRLSASFFIARMTYFGPQTRPAYVIATLSCVWMVGSVFAVAIRGDVSQPWQVLDGSKIMVRLLTRSVNQLSMSNKRLSVYSMGWCRRERPGNRGGVVGLISIHCLGPANEAAKTSLHPISVWCSASVSTSAYIVGGFSCLTSC